MDTINDQCLTPLFLKTKLLCIIWFIFEKYCWQVYLMYFYLKMSSSNAMFLQYTVTNDDRPRACNPFQPFVLQQYEKKCHVMTRCPVGLIEPTPCNVAKRNLLQLKAIINPYKRHARSCVGRFSSKTSVKETTSPTHSHECHYLPSTSEFYRQSRH